MSPPHACSLTTAHTSAPPPRTHLTQSIFICAGKGSLSYSMVPKLLDIPRLKMMYIGSSGMRRGPTDAPVRGCVAGVVNGLWGRCRRRGEGMRYEQWGLLLEARSVCECWHVQWWLR